MVSKKKHLYWGPKHIDKWDNAYDFELVVCKGAGKNVTLCGGCVSITALEKQSAAKGRVSTPTVSSRQAS